MKIPLMDIGLRDRFRREMGELETLAADMRSTGQITAITVRKTSEDDRLEGFEEPWMLVAGGRRYGAALINGWPDIDALTMDELPPLERAIMELHENLHRKELTWDEEVELKAEIHKRRLAANPEHKQYQTAQELKETPKTISMDLRLAAELEANPELKNAGSKKAAMRQVEMGKHLDRLAAQSERGMQTAVKLRSRLHTADAIDWLRKIPDATVDMLYSDPPWGIDYFTQGQKDNRGVVESGSMRKSGLSHYDDSAEATQNLMENAIPEMIRVCKPTGWIVLHCGYDAYRDWEKVFVEAKLKAEPLPWIWHRPNSNNPSRFPERHAQNVYEYLLVINRGEARLLRPCTNLLTYDAEYGSRIHAMQKPIDLCKDIISRFTFPGHLVVDPFFGSGALLAAAAATQRNFLGCELNEGLLEPALGFVSQHYVGD